MTPNIHAAHELVERELEQLANAINGDPAQAVMILPVFTMLTIALDLINKAIAFDYDTTTPHPHGREVIP